MVGVFGIFAVYRMPPEDVSEFAKEVIGKLDKGEMWAYVVLGFVIVLWWGYARVSRRVFSEEAKRIGREKSQLQNEMSDVDLESSDR